MRLVFIALVGLSLSCLLSAQALPEQPADIGYSSPNAALVALRSKPGVIITKRPGWTVIEDKSEGALWTIAEPGNPAYPSAVKRYLAKEGGAMRLEMKVLSGASKEACDNMVRQFQGLNSSIIKAAQ